MCKAKQCDKLSSLMIANQQTTQQFLVNYNNKLHQQRKKHVLAQMNHALALATAALKEEAAKKTTTTTTQKRTIRRKKHSHPLFLKEVPLQHIQVGELLGEGYFSQVFEIEAIHDDADLTLEEILFGNNNVEEQYDWFTTDSSHTSLSTERCSSSFNSTSTFFGSNSSMPLSSMSQLSSSNSNFTLRPKRTAPRLALKCIHPSLLQREGDPHLARVASKDLATEADLLGRLSAAYASDNNHPGHNYIIRLHAVSSDFYTQPMGRFLILDCLSETLEQRIRHWRSQSELLSSLHKKKKSPRSMMKSLLLPHHSSSGHRYNGSTANEQQQQERMAAQVGLQVAQGMAYLHSQKIIFRDLKPANIGFDAVDDSVKIFDFGLARRLPLTPVSTTTTADDDNTDNYYADRYCLTKMTGTLRYMAPEVFQGESYGFAADVYSYALVLHESLTFNEPFPSLFQQQQQHEAEDTSYNEEEDEDSQQHRQHRLQYEHHIVQDKVRPHLSKLHYGDTSSDKNIGNRQQQQQSDTFSQAQSSSKSTPASQPQQPQHQTMGGNMGGIGMISLLESHTFRPSLIRNLADLPDIPDESSNINSGGGNNISFDGESAYFLQRLNITMAPPRPRRLWNVSDTNLRPFPLYYPRENNRCIRLVQNTPPSVIAIRIAECLRKRSIAVEYDDESALVTCMTVDRCHFTIFLWAASEKHTPLLAKERNRVHRGSTADSLDGSYVGDLGAGTRDLGAGSKMANDAVLVEGLRQRGNLITFHRTLQAILEAACSLDTGADNRPVYQTNVNEYPRMIEMSSETYADSNLKLGDPFMLGSSASSTVSGVSRNCGDFRRLLKLPIRQASAISSASMEALEQVAQMLRKDRLEAHITGMERLVALTDVYTSGLDVAMYAAMAVLGAPLVMEGDDGSVATKALGRNAPASAAAVRGHHAMHPRDFTLAREIHEKWILKLIIDRLLPGEFAIQDYVSTTTPSSGGGAGRFFFRGLGGGAAAAAAETSFAFTCAQSLFGDGGASASARERIEAEEKGLVMVGDEHHGGILRSMALRALCNSLTVLEEEQPAILSSILQVQSPKLTAPPLINALLEDLAGASRPPAVVFGTRLASQHEAAMAVRCLRILGKHSEVAKRRMLKDSAMSGATGTTQPTILLLEKARAVGHSTHEVLSVEATRAYHELTEDFRSC